MLGINLPSMVINVQAETFPSAAKFLLKMLPFNSAIQSLSQRQMVVLMNKKDAVLPGI